MTVRIDRPTVRYGGRGGRSFGPLRSSERLALFGPVSLFGGALLSVLLLGLLVGLCPQKARGQESSDPIAEGRILHNPTSRLYYYRVEKDSVVLVRQERPATKRPGVIIPATTLSSINERTADQLRSSHDSGYIGFGYEDQGYVIRVSQRFDLYVLGTLIVVVLGGGTLLLWLWRRLSKERRRREALIRSRRYLTEGREKERERLAQEIHDGPVQDLHGLHMQLKSMPDAPDPDRMETMAEELMRVTGELRALSADLHPPALQRFGLASALRSHADRLRERHSALQIDLDLTDDVGPLPDEQALALFRVAQEALNNAAQHGNASLVRVRLRRDDRAVELTVRDDGDGFVPPSDWHDLAEQDHYGLLGMRERAEAVGADLDIDSRPGDGTRVHLRCALGALSEEAAPSNREAPVPA